jgi:FkbM family methyltransferase
VTQPVDSAVGWESGYARSRAGLLLAALVRSLTTVRPERGSTDVYLRTLARAFAAWVRSGTPRPVEQFLPREIWVRYQGLEYWLTRETLFGYYLHAFEPLTARSLLGMQGDVFVDVGANSGQYVVPLARRFRRVIAVEPNPIALTVLRKNLAENRISNVEVIGRALSTRSGVVRLYEGEVITTWSTKPTSGRFVDVESTSLDDVLRLHPTIDLLKVDIEGLEAEVLLSSKLLERVRVLCFACLPHQLPPLRKRLNGSGFNIDSPASLFRSDENYFARRIVP